MNSLFRRRRRDQTEQSSVAPSRRKRVGARSSIGQDEQFVTNPAPKAAIIEVASIGNDNAQRFWQADGRRIVDDSGPLVAGCHRVTYTWESDAEWNRYWLAGDGPLPPLQVSNSVSSADFDFASWPLSGRCAIELPGASFSMRLTAIGGARNPLSAIQHNIVIVDGQPQQGPSDFEPDVAITGDVMMLARWLSGSLGFRDVARHLQVTGDFFLLGAIAGVYGVVGGAGIDPKCCAALRVALDLVQCHRGFTPEGELP